LSDATPELSIVVPMHNEAANVEPLHAQLVAALEPLGRSAELVFVDDGSSDATFERLADLHRGQGTAGGDGPSVEVLRLRRQFGKSAALAAGFDAARGHIVLTLDGDLQDDPAEIPRFLDKLDEGYDLVTGWKRRRHDPPSKVLASRLFNLVVSRLSGLPLHDVNCGFKAYRRPLVDELQLRGGLHRYIPVLGAARGYRCAEIEVAHRPRQHGSSKYGLARLVTAPLDLLTVLLLTRYAARPLHFFGGLGVACFAAGLVLDVVQGVLWLAGRPLVGMAMVAFVGALLMLLGVQLIAVGLLAEHRISRDGGHPRPYSIAERLPNRAPHASPTT